MTKEHNKQIDEKRDYYIKRLKECQKIDDRETAHEEADKILCELLIELGYKDVVYEWGEVSKWYA